MFETQENRLNPLTEGRDYKDRDMRDVKDILVDCYKYALQSDKTFDEILKAYHISELQRQNDLMAEDGNLRDIAMLEICKQLAEIKHALNTISFK